MSLEFWFELLFSVINIQKSKNAKVFKKEISTDYNSFFKAFLRH